METWNQDPKKYLVMYLKLRNGVQFSNSSGKIETSLPEVLKPSVIKPWQYRMMMLLDGKEQFIEVVKQVKDQFAGDFEATDVWTFLYWLIDQKLLDSKETASEQPDDKKVVLPDVIESGKPKTEWVKVPLQALAILLVCTFVLFAVSRATPMVAAWFKGAPSSDPIEELAAEVEAIKATRMPHFAQQEEVVFAGQTPPTEESDFLEEPQPDDSDIVEKLVDLRQEMSACQIRRNEYYLLNNEEGYTKEVERISEIAKEIGKISSELLDEPIVSEPIVAEPILTEPTP